MADRGATLIETIVASAVLATAGATALVASSHLASTGIRLRERPTAIATVLAVRDELSRAATQGMLCEAVAASGGAEIRLEPACDLPGPWQVRVAIATSPPTASPRIWWTVVP